MIDSSYRDKDKGVLNVRPLYAAYSPTAQRYVSPTRIQANYRASDISKSVESKNRSHSGLRHTSPGNVSNKSYKNIRKRRRKVHGGSIPTEQHLSPASADRQEPPSFNQHVVGNYKIKKRKVNNSKTYKKKRDLRALNSIPSPRNKARSFNLVERKPQTQAILVTGKSRERAQYPVIEPPHPARINEKQIPVTRLELGQVVDNPQAPNNAYAYDRSFLSMNEVARQVEPYLQKKVKSVKRKKASMAERRRQSYNTSFLGEFQEQRRPELKRTKTVNRMYRGEEAAGQDLLKGPYTSGRMLSNPYLEKISIKPREGRVSHLLQERSQNTNITEILHQQRERSHLSEWDEPQSRQPKLSALSFRYKKVFDNQDLNLEHLKFDLKEQTRNHLISKRRHFDSLGSGQVDRPLYHHHQSIQRPKAQAIPFGAPLDSLHSYRSIDSSRSLNRTHFRAYRLSKEANQGEARRKTSFNEGLRQTGSFNYNFGQQSDWAFSSARNDKVRVQDLGEAQDGFFKQSPILKKLKDLTNLPVSSGRLLDYSQKKKVGIQPEVDLALQSPSRKRTNESSDFIFKKSFVNSSVIYQSTNGATKIQVKKHQKMPQTMLGSGQPEFQGRGHLNVFGSSSKDSGTFGAMLRQSSHDKENHAFLDNLKFYSARDQENRPETPFDLQMNELDDPDSNNLFRRAFMTENVNSKQKTNLNTIQGAQNQDPVQDSQISFLLAPDFSKRATIDHAYPKERPSTQNQNYTKQRHTSYIPLARNSSSSQKEFPVLIQHEEKDLFLGRGLGPRYTSCNSGYVRSPRVSEAASSSLNPRNYRSTKNRLSNMSGSSAAAQRGKFRNQLEIDIELVRQKVESERRKRMGSNQLMRPKPKFKIYDDEEDEEKEEGIQQGEKIEEDNLLKEELKEVITIPGEDLGMTADINASGLGDVDKKSIKRQFMISHQDKEMIQLESTIKVQNKNQVDWGESCYIVQRRSQIESQKATRLSSQAESGRFNSGLTSNQAAFFASQEFNTSRAGNRIAEIGDLNQSTNNPFSILNYHTRIQKDKAAAEAQKSKRLIQSRPSKQSRPNPASASAHPISNFVGYNTVSTQPETRKRGLKVERESNQSSISTKIYQYTNPFVDEKSKNYKKSKKSKSRKNQPKKQQKGKVSDFDKNCDPPVKRDENLLERSCKGELTPQRGQASLLTPTQNPPRSKRSQKLKKSRGSDRKSHRSTKKTKETVIQIKQGKDMDVSQVVDCVVLNSFADFRDKPSGRDQGFPVGGTQNKRVESRQNKNSIQSRLAKIRKLKTRSNRISKAKKAKGGRNPAQNVLT